MIKKINRLDCIERFPKLPLREYNKAEEEYDFYYPETLAGYVLTLLSKSYRGQLKMMGEEITNLTGQLGADRLIFLGDLNMPWFYREKYFSQFPLRNHANVAFRYLTHHKIGKRFNGGLEVEKRELPVFIQHIAWLVRTNGVLPYVHFTDPGQNMVADICQFGNLHLYTCSGKASQRLKQVINASKFERVAGDCYNRFSKNNSIKERKMTI